jgi:hypothetical protein
MRAGGDLALFDNPWARGLAGLAFVGVLALIVRELWHRRVEDAALQKSSLPACAARLGSEDECARHFRLYHEDCARLTRTHGSRTRGGPSVADPTSYLACVVLGVDGWVEKNRLDRERSEQERREDLAPR